MSFSFQSINQYFLIAVDSSNSLIDIFTNIKDGLLDILDGQNRYPNQNQNPYNPLGNNAANGILVGPGGPTGLYGRPNNFGPNQLPFNGGFGGGPYNNGFNNNYGPQYNGGGFPQNGPIPFNSKSGSGISAEADEPKGRELDKKTNE